MDFVSNSLGVKTVKRHTSLTSSFQLPVLLDFRYILQINDSVMKQINGGGGMGREGWWLRNTYRSAS